MNRKLSNKRQKHGNSGEHGPTSIPQLCFSHFSSLQTSHTHVCLKDTHQDLTGTRTQSTKNGVQKVEKGTDELSHQGEAERICISNLQLTITFTPLILKCSDRCCSILVSLFYSAYLIENFCQYTLPNVNIDASCNNIRSFDLFTLCVCIHTHMYVHA